VWFWDIRRSLRSHLALLSSRQLLTRCSGTGFTSLRRDLGWLPPGLPGTSSPAEQPAPPQRLTRPGRGGWLWPGRT
jgi:hypothetical protein